MMSDSAFYSENCNHSGDKMFVIDRVPNCSSLMISHTEKNLKIFMDQIENIPTAGAETRRDFIKKAATAAAVVASTNIFKTPVYGQNQAPSPGRVIGANDRIVVGFIGVGGQGMQHVNSMKKYAADNNIAQPAVCDVSKTRIANAKQAIGGDCEGFEDHRKLLERKDIDAVCISTVDHWHTPCSIDAMNAGKHVYVEKPMTRYLEEAFAIYDTVKRTGKVLQVGSQGCTDAKWHQSRRVGESWQIGPVVAHGRFLHEEY
jgi:hypothetical protein